MLILILINIIIIIWIYLKYYNSQTNKNITNQEITKMDSIIIGSINDKKTNKLFINLFVKSFKIKNDNL